MAKTFTRPFHVVIILAILMSLMGIQPVIAADLVFIVNSTADRFDSSPGDGVCETATPGECTLRAAIQEANATPGLDSIYFNIPGTGVQSIRPQSPLPVITDPVIIDGYTQPVAAPNTLEIGNNAQLLIELDGFILNGIIGLIGNGLTIETSDSTVRGLVINRFRFSSGISITGSSATSNVIEGNFIGTDASGTVVPVGGRTGVNIDAGASNNIIGGTTVGARNVISGNGNGNGVMISDANTTGNIVMGNFIGTDASGTAALGNAAGVLISNNASGNTVGGTVAGSSNIISGNGGQGINISTSTSWHKWDFGIG